MLDPGPDHQGRTLALLRGIEQFLQTSKSFSAEKISAVFFVCLFWSFWLVFVCLWLLWGIWFVDLFVSFFFFFSRGSWFYCISEQGSKVECIATMLLRKQNLSKHLMCLKTYYNKSRKLLCFGTA